MWTLIIHTGTCDLFYEYKNNSVHSRAREQEDLLKCRMSYKNTEDIGWDNIEISDISCGLILWLL